jgi:hypothetical protein
MYNGPSSSNSSPSGSVDPYALFEALTGKKINKAALSETSSRMEDYDDVRDFADDDKHDNRPNLGREIQVSILLACILLSRLWDMRYDAHLSYVLALYTRKLTQKSPICPPELILTLVGELA